MKKVIFLVLFALLLTVQYFISEMIISHLIDVYYRGFRYTVMLIGLVVFPMAIVGTAIHLVYYFFKNRKIDKGMVLLQLKYVGVIIALYLVYFVTGMIFNDASAPGAIIQ